MLHAPALVAPAQPRSTYPHPSIHPSIHPTTRQKTQSLNQKDTKPELRTKAACHILTQRNTRDTHRNTCTHMHTHAHTIQNPSPAPIDLFLSSMFPPCRGCRVWLLQKHSVVGALGSTDPDHFESRMLLHAAVCIAQYAQGSRDQGRVGVAEVT